MIASGTYAPNTTGARTLKDAKPLTVNGRKVTAEVSGTEITVFAGGEKVFEGQIPAGITSTNDLFAWIIETVNTPTQPKNLVFEMATCGRCGGKGRKSDGGWAANNQGRCFRCGGTGRDYTANGVRAKNAFVAAREAQLGTTWGELTEGDAFWYDSKCYIKGQHKSLVLREETSVLRHHGATTRKIWAEIAAKYKGATLVY